MDDDKECFFISPIGDEGSEARKRSNKVMEYIIEKAVSEYGYSVTRADQMDQPGSITNQVIQKTVNSELVIADLTDHNPNVFYELAVRHATGKPYIQLIKSTNSIPFDIADLRTINYGLEVDEAERAREQIQGLLQSLKEGEPEFDNPISESAEMQSLRESADPADQNLAEVLDMVYKLNNKVDQIERSVVESNSTNGNKDAAGGGAQIHHKQSELNKDDLKVLDIIKRSESNAEKPVQEGHIIEQADRLGIPEDIAEKSIDNLLMEGHIYKPDDNSYKVI
jgi:DNA-directed RNA polymerase